jgi:hypothetical protein
MLHRVIDAIELRMDQLLGWYGRHPVRTTIAYLTFVVVVGAALYSIAEGKGIDYIDGLWWAIVTLTTVGYGDIAPESVGMRLVAVWVIASGIVSVALATAAIAARMAVARMQQADQTPGIDDDFDALQADLSNAVERVQHLQHRYRLDEHGDDRLAAAARAVLAEARNGSPPQGVLADLERALELQHRTDA